jgi:hypothetical protein
MLRMFKGDKSFIPRTISVSQFMIVSWAIYWYFPINMNFSATTFKPPTDEQFFLDKFTFSCVRGQQIFLDKFCWLNTRYIGVSAWLLRNVKAIYWALNVFTV